MGETGGYTIHPVFAYRSALARLPAVDVARKPGCPFQGAGAPSEGYLHPPSVTQIYVSPASTSE
jgi:hypothetical protein